MSCRAFWRRAHQKTRSPVYECRKSGKCVLTLTNRRACQKCRYVRCQLAGMEASAVLTEEQRQFRFRKVIERKSSRQNRRRSGTRSETTSEDEAGRLSRSTLFPPLTSEQQLQQQQHQVDEVRLNKWGKILQPKVEMIVQNYQKLQDNNNLLDNLFETVNSVFEDVSNVNFYRKEILSYNSIVSQEFRLFANMHRLILFLKINSLCVI